MAAKRIALSVQIQNILHERILNNTYQKDELLPSESALCEEFGVSRTTIRDAISALAEKGFVRIGGQSVVKAHSRGTLTEQGLAKLLQADAGGRNGSKTVDVER